jgi:hypothetical protein
VWSGAAETGYWCAPRSLPLLLSLSSEKALVGGADCSSAYVELLARDFGQGIVEIYDEDEHAFFAGYRGDRARRTWRERILALEKAGFIAIKPKGNRDIGYVLLRHPDLVVRSLRAENKIDDRWWQSYESRRRDVGGRVVAPRTTMFEMIQGGAKPPVESAPSASGRKGGRPRLVRSTATKK